jgi:adenylate kinase family enzyme
VPDRPRRVAVIASASGNGKTTVARALAEQLAVPFVELDALHWGPEWREATAEELRARVEPIVESDAWVIDGVYRGKLGDLVVANADLVVWLDLPMRIWFPRLLGRTLRRTIRC